MDEAKQTVVQILARVDAIFNPRPPLERPGPSNYWEAQAAYQDVGIPWRIGGDANARKAGQTLLDKLEAAKLIDTPRRHGKRAGVKLTEAGDCIARALCWLPQPAAGVTVQPTVNGSTATALDLVRQVSDLSDRGACLDSWVWECWLPDGAGNEAALLSGYYGAPWSLVNEREATDRVDEEFTAADRTVSEEEIKEHLLDLNELATPALVRNWLASRSNSANWLFLAVTRAGRRALKTYKAPAIDLPHYDLDCGDAYYEAFKETTTALKTAKPARPNNLGAIPLPASLWAEPAYDPTRPAPAAKVET